MHPTKTQTSFSTFIQNLDNSQNLDEDTYTHLMYLCATSSLQCILTYSWQFSFYPVFHTRWIAFRQSLRYFTRPIWIYVVRYRKRTFPIRWHPFRKLYTLIPQQNSLSNNVVTSLAEDRYGNLWIGTQNGLNRYDRIHNHFQQYTTQNGLKITLSELSMLTKKIIYG